MSTYTPADLCLLDALDRLTLTRLGAVIEAEVQGRDGEHYRVRLDGSAWACSCPALQTLEGTRARPCRAPSAPRRHPATEPCAQEGTIMKTLPSLRTPATVLALAAAALAIVALILAVVALQGSASAAPAPTAAAECRPIRIAPDEAATRADSLANAVAAVRLAAPDREIDLLDLGDAEEADFRVEHSEGAGAYYGDRPVILLRVPQDGSGLLWLSGILTDRLPGCEAEEVMSG